MAVRHSVGPEAQRLFELLRGLKGMEYDRLVCTSTGKRLPRPRILCFGSTSSVFVLPRGRAHPGWLPGREDLDLVGGSVSGGHRDRRQAFGEGSG